MKLKLGYTLPVDLDIGRINQDAQQNKKDAERLQLLMNLNIDLLCLMAIPCI